MQDQSISQCSECAADLIKGKGGNRLCPRCYHRVYMVGYRIKKPKYVAQEAAKAKANPESARIRQAAYRARHPDRVAAYKATHKEIEAAQSKARYTPHPRPASTRKGTREYRVWKNMRSRCSNPNTPGYADYGGRGITVCQEWDDFAQFLADMGPCPSPEHTIERQDNSLGYSSDNCIWETRTMNNRNRRNTKRITFQGETRPLAEWAEILDIPYGCLNHRLWRGWSVEDTLSSPKLR